MLNAAYVTPKAFRKRFRSEEREQPSKMHKDHSVSTLHPTKGWRRISGRRIAAGVAMADVLGSTRTVIGAGLPKRRPKMYEGEAIRRAAGVVLKRKFPQPETRQQRRHKARHG